MPMLRALRLVNAISSGNTSGACLDSLLCGDPGRCADFASIMALPGQTYTIASSPTAMCAIFNSSAATCVALTYPVMCARIVCNPATCISANSGVVQAISSYVNSSCAMTKLANLATNFSALTTGNNTCFINCFFSSATAICVFSTTSCSLNYSCGYGHTTMNSFLASAYGSCWFPYMSFQNNPCAYATGVPFCNASTQSCCCYCANNMSWNPKGVSSLNWCGTVWWIMNGATCNVSGCYGCSVGVGCAPCYIMTPSALVSNNCGASWFPVFTYLCYCNFSGISYGSSLIGPSYQNYGFATACLYNTGQYYVSMTALCGCAGKCYSLFSFGSSCAQNYGCGAFYNFYGILGPTPCCITSFSVGPGLFIPFATACCGFSGVVSAATSFSFNASTTCNIAISHATISGVAIWVSQYCACSCAFNYVNATSINNACNNCCSCWSSSASCNCLSNMGFQAAAAICNTIILIPNNTSCKVVLTCDVQTFTCGTNNPCSYVNNIQQFACVCNYLWAWPASGQTAAYSTNCGATWTCYCLPYNASNWNLVFYNGGWMAATPCESNNKVFYSPNCGVTWYTANLNSNACWAVVCNSGSNNCWFSVVNCSGCVQHIF